MVLDRLGGLRGRRRGGARPHRRLLRFDPETTRCPVAGPEGLTLIAIGAPRGADEPRGPLLMIVRIVLWSLADSKTTIEELSPLPPR